MHAAGYTLERANDGKQIIYTYLGDGEESKMAALLRDLDKAGIELTEVETRETSLEEIFVNLVQGRS